MVKIALLTFVVLLQPLTVQADSNYFRGTRTGWSLTEQVAGEGRYKKQNLFIVVGTKPTTEALHTIRGWKSKTTYLQDLGEGVDIFGEQMSKSVSSIPENGSDAGKSIADFFVDPVNEIGSFSLLTPITLVWKTTVNVLRIGWNGTMLVAEPVFRAAYGTVALLGAPFVKPVTYTGVALIYSGTALYGYGSSLAAGTVMTAATGTVLALDIATVPAVALYEASQPDEDGETVIMDDEDDEETDDPETDEQLTSLM
jgi:hypothetical protein